MTICFWLFICDITVLLSYFLSLFRLEVIAFGADFCFTADVLFMFLFQREISEADRREVLHDD